MSRKRLPQDCREAALALRNDEDSRFKGSESPEDVAFAVLEDRVAELKESRSRAAEKREELKEAIGVSTDDGEAEELTDAEQRQAELRDRMRR